MRSVWSRLYSCISACCMVEYGWEQSSHSEDKPINKTKIYD